jgi:hypothetical protein
MNEVAQKANELLKEHVETDVYDVGTALGRNYYHDGKNKPTGQLRDSITNTNAKITGNAVEAEIYHDSSKMDYNADSYLHGSRYWTPNDVRDILPYLIDQGKTGGMFGSAWENLKRPYLTNTKKELSDGLLDKWMQEALKKRGINISVGVSVK